MQPGAHIKSTESGAGLFYQGRSYPGVKFLISHDGLGTQLILPGSSIIYMIHSRNRKQKLFHS